MAVTFPYVRAAVWADGSTTDTAAKRNTIEDGIFNAHQAPAVRVTHNTTQSIANSTAVALAFNTERFDQAGGAASTQHDTVTNNSRLTCRYAGIYFIQAQIIWANSPATGGSLNLRLNGVTGIGMSDNGNTTFSAVASTLYQLAVNDYVEATVFQTSGGALNVTAVSNTTPEFMMVRVA